MATVAVDLIKTEPDDKKQPASKVTRRNKQKHNETERKRREHLAQLFEDVKKELQEEQESQGEEVIEMENRNAVLEQALIHIRRLKVRASASRPQTKNEKFDDIPGLRNLVEYVDYLKLQLSRKRKLTPDTEKPERATKTKCAKGKNPPPPPTNFTQNYPATNAPIQCEAFWPYFHNSSSSSSSDESPTSSSPPMSSSPDSYTYPTETLSDFEYEDQAMGALPQQSTSVVDFSRLLFSIVFFFGLFYTWSNGNAAGLSGPGVVEPQHVGRVLQEHSGTPASTLKSFSFFSTLTDSLWMLLLWNPIAAIFVMLFCYIVVLVTSEPVMSPSSYFYQQAEKEYKQALNAGTTDACEKHYLNALAFLGRAFPSGVQLYIGIVFQFVRYLLHCMYIGVWLDKLLLFTRGGEASHKQAADLYLSLMRNCHGKIQGLDLIYLSLCTINISQLFDPIWVAETYAHISFFLEYRIPRLKMLASFYLQLAWRIAKSENNPRLVWLLYATSHLNVRKGNWADAETYLRHILDKLSKLQQTLGGRALPTSAQTLIRYTNLTKATIELGKGSVPKSLAIIKELEKLCYDPSAKKSELSKIPGYNDPACARLAMIIEALCLIRMERDREADDVLSDVQKLNDESEAPSCAMEEVARESLVAYVYYLAGNKKMALVEAEKALLFAHSQDGQQLYVWPAYTLFVELQLLVWEHVAKETPFGSALDYLLPSSGAWEIDEDGRPKVDLEGENGRKIVLRHLENQVREGINILEKNANYMTVISPIILRYKGKYSWLTGNTSKAISQFELSLQKARELGMTYEEAKTIFTMGKCMMDNKCRCLNKKRHNVTCAVHHFEAANALFVKCGAVFNSHQALEMIEAHQKASSMPKSTSTETLLTSEDGSAANPSLMHSSSSSPSLYEVLSTQDTVV